jgi:hypothetical protein
MKPLTRWLGASRRDDWAQTVLHVLNVKRVTVELSVVVQRKLHGGQR